MHGIEYNGFNEKLSEEEIKTLTDLLFRMVRWAKGGVNGILFLENDETGESMEIHIDVHDARLCTLAHELQKIDELDKKVT